MTTTTVRTAATTMKSTTIQYRHQHTRTTALLPFFILVLLAVILCSIQEVQGFSVPCPSLLSTPRYHVLAASIRDHRPLSTATTTTSLYLSSPSSATSSDVRRVLDWIKDESLESLISKDETIAICRELTGDLALIDSVEQAVIENWDKIVQKLIRSEDEGNGAGRRNTLSQLLGDEATQRLLRGVQNLDVYSDQKTVNAFLQSDAVNDLFAQTLCKYRIFKKNENWYIISILYCYYCFFCDVLTF